MITRLIDAVAWATFAAAAVAAGVVLEQRRPGGSRAAWTNVDELIRALEHRADPAPAAAPAARRLHPVAQQSTRPPSTFRRRGTW